MSVYDYTMKDADGNQISLGDYKGKVLLIVNTATGCGFTPQYKGLEELYNKYQAHGFEIFDFTCNLFGNQAPGTESEIVSFCQLNYGVSFKQFAKIEVNGVNEAPLYTYLKKQKGGLLSSAIKWNFTKFLV
ncbi:MAG: glutathione peroxidase, partial [Clostridia bacterium]|nr:glutathione peroxidase [Clostridia bacterium]